MKILLLELNEFNEDLLQKAANNLPLKNIQKLLTFHRSRTQTDDTYDSGFLEPWVQWVNIHTSLPSSEHQVKHLGDSPSTDHQQLWEKLSDRKISSGIWGAMNSKRSKASNCCFFFPDPWTTAENAYPEELNYILQPLRYVSKHYTRFSKRVLISSIKDLLKIAKKNNLIGFLSKEILLLTKNVFLYRFKPFVFISFLDYVSSHFFLKYQMRHEPTFSLLFLNSIAHLQHHQWHSLDEISPGLKHGFKKMDKILGKIFNQLNKDDMLIVTNALSQKNTNDEKPWVLYRQIDQKKFLKAAGIHDVRIDSHMTHDAHLFFPSIQLAKQSAEILQSVTVQGSPFFHIESYPNNPLKLFYKIQFTDPVESDAYLTISNKQYRFFDFFKAIVKRTGRHIQMGTIFCNQPVFPDNLKNHEIGEHILKICDQYYLK